MMKIFSCGLMLGFALFLSGCSDKQVELKGTQIPVLASEAAVEVDGANAHVKIQVPPQEKNKLWTHEAFQPNHHMVNFALPASVGKCFNVSIGTGSSYEHRLLASPLVGDDNVYTFDARGTLRAINKQTGKRLFSVNTRPAQENVPIGHGGLAYGQGRIFVATGYAQLISVDANTGACVWRKELSAPARSAPTLSKGLLFVTTVDNVVSAYEADQGNLVWTYTGLTENAGLLGLASPAVHQDKVIVPFSSGEVIALKAETGMPLWGEALSSSRRADAVTNIATIKAQPVVMDNVVYVVGHAGRMVALDVNSGDMKWEKMIGGTQTPLVVGNVVYVVSNRAELICMHKTDGKVLWKQQLQAKTSGDHEVHWQGPVLAGDMLLLTNSLGQLVYVAPDSGQVRQYVKIGEPFELAPIVADNTLYLLSDRATLYSFR